MGQQLFISVIIPVYNGSKFLGLCLDALLASSYPSFEVIVVDDASTDESAAISRKKGVMVIQLPRLAKLAGPAGPAAARNYGAQRARGEILLFVDADVVVQQETVSGVATDFLEHPNLAAVFGSYDDDPAEKNFISQYKNLYHHFVHQLANDEAVTFWAGCGAVRREVFDAVGGFDQYLYPKPSIEDIEMGYRMRGMGHRILLDKKLQVKHLKQWSFRSLLSADIFCRAIPWSKLILRSQHMLNDLNLQTSQRISAGSVGLSVLLLPFSLFKPQLFYGILVLLALIFVLNYKLYKFFISRRGLKFAVLAFPLHLLYYFYSGVTFALCWGLHTFRRKRSTISPRKIETSR